jgi:conjugal transfer pilin signal peptidase TrbI
MTILTPTLTPANMTMKLKNKQIIIALTALALISGVVLLKNNFLIIHNKSESLPSHWFVISKGQIPQKDQIFAFKAKDNPAYETGEIFIKIVGGIAGDAVITKERNFYITNQFGDKFIGTAKTVSLKGQPLTMSDSGIIPPQYYFAYTTHKDSYDSRYQQIGLINETQIIGTAVLAF